MVGLRSDDAVVEYGPPRFEDRERLHVDGTYYRVVVDPQGTEEITRPSLTAEEVEGHEDDAVPVERYDDSAEEIVQDIVVHAYRGSDEDHVFYADEARPASLDPEPRYAYVIHQDRVFRLAVEERTVDAKQFEYRWTAFPIDGQTVENEIRSQSDVADAADLSSEARSILETARDDPPYSSSEPFSDAEEAVFEVLDVETKGVGKDERRLTFDGAYYEARVTWSHSD